MLLKIILSFLPLSVALENHLHNYCMFISACTCACYQVLFKAHLKYSYPQMSDSYVELTSCCKSWPPRPSERNLRLQEHSQNRGSVPACVLGTRAGAAEDTGKPAAWPRREAVQSEKQQENCQQHT